MKKNDWIKKYIAEQKHALDSINSGEVVKLIQILANALKQNRQIFVMGNGGSSSNTSHFATDLGKSASDKIGKRFKVFSLNDNVSWITALGNDYSYEDIFTGQLKNFAMKGDVVITASVSGNSPNLVSAFQWAKKHGLITIALVGAKRGRLFNVADYPLVVDSIHYGKVEDAQMTILHMLCYAFVENPNWAKKSLLGS